MKYRDIQFIKEEMNQVKSILNRWKKHLKNDKKPLIAKAMVAQYSTIYRRLKRELCFALKEQGINSFDVYISNMKDENIVNSSEDFSNVISDVVNSDFANLSSSISNKSSLEVTNVEEGSLRITFSSVYKDKENPTLKGALEVFNRMVDCGDDIDKLKDLKGEVGDGPIENYLKLLRLLKENNLNLSLYDTFDSFLFGKKLISNNVANSVIGKLDNN